MEPPSNRWRLCPLLSGIRPAKNTKPPPQRAEKLKRKGLEPKVSEDADSLLHNIELAVGAVSSILKDSDLERSKMLPVDESLALSFQGAASVSFYVTSRRFFVLS